MSETTVRELFQQAMAGEEPPIGAHLVGNAVRRARTTRRRRVAAGAGATAAGAAVVAFGVPAIAGALSPAVHVPHGYAFGPSAPGAVKAHTSSKPYVRVRSSHSAASDAGIHFFRPKLPKVPRQSTEASLVPVTEQSLGQLLIDDVPAGARLSQIEATTNMGNGSQVAEAEFNKVTTARGSGMVQAIMWPAGQKAADFGCPVGATGVTCVTYSYKDGVKVAEEFSTGQVIKTGKTWESLMVSVFRPRVAEFSISERDQAMAAGSPVTKGMPLTLAQLASATLDPRWQFTISQSFVQQASGLIVVPPDSAGS